MRINARIDEKQLQQLEQIKKQEQITTTQVVKRALDHYFQHQKSKKQLKIEKLLISDFIGCAEGPADLSDNYKQKQSEALIEKHDID